MHLTVGAIENKLRQFPKNTEVTLSCGRCHLSSSGEETILGIEDNTDQTYGYIELNFNNSSKSEVELSDDREEFYKKEIEKLHKENQKLKLESQEYMRIIKSIKSRLDLVNLAE